MRGVVNVQGLEPMIPCSKRQPWCISLVVSVYRKPTCMCQIPVDSSRSVSFLPWGDFWCLSVRRETWEPPPDRLLERHRVVGDVIELFFSPKPEISGEGGKDDWWRRGRGEKGREENWRKWGRWVKRNTILQSRQSELNVWSKCHRLSIPHSCFSDGCCNKNCQKKQRFALSTAGTYATQINWRFWYFEMLGRVDWSTSFCACLLKAAVLFLNQWCLMIVS